MAAGPTYEPIATTTLSSTTTAFTISSIPSTYTDLKIVFSYYASSFCSTDITFNSDTAANYSHVYAKSSRSTPTTSRTINASSINCSSSNSPGSTVPLITTIEINSYTAAVNKSVYFETGSDAGTYGYLTYGLGTWRSTSAITSITFTEGNASGFDSGSTVTIYGIKAA